jgi:hypothetical protein
VQYLGLSDRSATRIFGNDRNHGVLSGLVPAHPAQEIGIQKGQVAGDDDAAFVRGALERHLQPS